MDFNQLLVLYLSLGGVSGAVTLTVNSLKTLHVVKDGTAQNWSFGLNLLGLVALYVVKSFYPGLDIPRLDSGLASVLPVLTVVLGFVMQLVASPAFHAALRGIAVIGKSHSNDVKQLLNKTP